ncbi:MAG: efflux transporter outer membrane subunit [Proteobacteria bacterium]|nr:efflux transporter outer membrane subunit [Pseudomonadota bacterium]
MPPRAARSLRAAVLATLVLALPACTMGPDYARPQADVPPAYPVPATSLPPEPPSSLPPVNIAIATTPAAATRWWTAFGDPTLDALVDEALAHNQNLVIAAANVDAAAAILTQTRSSLFPQVGYNAAAERQRVPDTGLAAIIPNYPNPQNAYQALLTASWEIDLWGRIRRLSEAARANLLATDAARDGVVLTVVCGVVQNYLALRGLDQQLEVSQRTLRTYAESVKLFELQFKYGQISQMNVAQVHSQYETAAAQIPQIETSIQQTENALSVLIGRNFAAIPRGRTIDQLAAPSIPTDLPSALLEQRPDLVQAEQQLIAANAQIGAARALYFPTISLTGALGSSSGALHDLFSGPTRVWSYAGQFVGPIFTAGAVSGQVAQAEAQDNAAVANYRLSIQNAFADVDNALVAHDRLREQWKAQTRLVAALAEYSRLAHLQYDAGYVPYSTVLQAEQSLFPAELNLAAIRTSMLNGSVNVYKAMGGGWVTAAAGAAPQPTAGR